MTNRIDQLFQRKHQRILSIFFTAGYPNADDTLPLVEELSAAGADMIEIGIPYSDPVADGPVIQHSSMVALNQGMTLSKLFSDLKDLRKCTDVPVLLMGYLNPVCQFGIAAFYESCAQTGIDGVILPDLPPEEYLEHHAAFANRYHIHVIFLVSPDTPPERARQLDRISRGFLYLISSNATTGTQKGVGRDLARTVEKLESLHLSNPLLIGFGVNGRQEFETVCGLARGAIVGSAFIHALASSTDLRKNVKEFISSIRPQ